MYQPERKKKRIWCNEQAKSHDKRRLAFSEKCLIHEMLFSNAVNCNYVKTVWKKYWKPFFVLLFLKKTPL